MMKVQLCLLVLCLAASAMGQIDLGNIGGIDLGNVGGVDLGNVDLGNVGGVDLGNVDLGNVGGVDLGNVDLGNVGGVDLGNVDLGNVGGVDLGDNDFSGCIFGICFGGGNSPADREDQAREDFDRLLGDFDMGMGFGDVSFDDILGGNITDDFLKDVMNPDLMRVMDDDMLMEMAGNMDMSQKDDLCKNVGIDADTDLLESMMDAGIDCLSTFSNDPTMTFDGGRAQVMMDKKRRDEPPSTWDKSDWELAMRMSDGVTMDDLDNMDTSVMMSMVEDGGFDVSAFSDNPSGQRAFNDRLKDSYGAMDSWGSAEMMKVGSLITNMDKDDMLMMDASALVGALSTFRNVSFDDPMKKAAFGKKVMEGLGGVSMAASFTADNIENAAQYMMTNPRMMEALDETSLLSAVSSFKEHVEDKRDALNLAKKLKGMSAYADPSALSASDLMDLGATLSGFPLSFTAGLDASAISGALDDLKDADFPRSQAKDMLQTLRDNGQFEPSSMSVNDMMSVGNLMAGFDKDDFEAMPAATIRDGLSDIAMLDLGMGQARGILQQLKSVMGGNFGAKAAEMGNLFQYAARSEVASLSFDDLKLDCDSTDTFDIEPSMDQAQMIMSKIKETMGGMNATGTNTNYTSSCFTRWGKMAAMGFPKADIEEMREDSEMFTIMESMKDYEGEMQESQTRAMCMKVKKVMLADEATAMAVDTSKASQVAPFMKHLTDMELEMLNDTVRPTVCEGMGAASMHTLPRSEVQRLKRFCMKNILRDTNSSVTDRTNSETRDDNDIRNLGNMLCGLEKADMDMMTQDAISNNLMAMSECGFEEVVGKALLQRCKTLDPDFLNSTDNIVGAGPLLMHLTQAEIDTELDTDILSESVMDMVDTLDTYDTMMKKRDEAFSGEKSTTERSTEKAGRQRLIQAALGAITSASRKKRSLRFKRATVYTCTDIQSLGNSATSVASEDLAAMDNSEFMDCLETFGDISDWDSDQLSALATQAKTGYGSDVSTWSTETVRQAGSICGGLSSSDIGTLDLSTDDVMTSLGAHDVFDSSQLTSGFSQYLSQAQSDDAANMDADALMALGNFACGADSSSIGDIMVSVYSDAASTIGALTTCEESQLQAYATLAKDASAFGSDVTAWSTSDITSIGTVLGGITSADMGMLSENQISVISTTTVGLMPASTFAGLDVTQIGYLTTSQANAVTATQQMALSDEQLDALVAAGATDLVNSGAGLVTYSLMLMALPFIALRV